MNYIERLEIDLDFYKEKLMSNKKFNNFSDVPSIVELQKRNMVINHKYFTRKVKYIKKELNRLRKNNQPNK